MFSRKEKKEVENLQQRAALADFLSLFFWGAKDLEEENQKIDKAKEFIYAMVYKNPYVKYKVLPSTIKFENLENNTSGKHRPFLNIVTINSSLLYDVFKEQKRRLSDILDTIGHELRHCYQDDIYEHKDDKKLTKEQKAKILSMNTNPTMLDIDDIHIAFLLAKGLGDKEVEIYFKLSDNEQKEICEFIKYAIYFNLEIEKDAKNSGIDFAKRMIYYWLNDPMVDKVVKCKLKEDWAYIDKVVSDREKEFLEINTNPIYKIFNNIVSNFDYLVSLSDVDEAFNVSPFLFENYEDLKRTEKIAKKIKKNISNVKKFMLSKSINHVDIEETINLLFECVETGNNFFNECYFQLTDSNDLPINYKKIIKSHVIDMLKYGDVSEQTYLLFNEFLRPLRLEEHFLSVKDYTGVVESLLEQGKLIFALNMVQTFSFNDFVKNCPYIKRVKSKVTNAVKEFLNQDTVSYIEFSTVKSILNCCSLIEIADLDEDKYKFIEMSQEFLYLEERYGLKFVEDIKKSEQIINSCIEEKNERKRQKSVVPIYKK